MGRIQLVLIISPLFVFMMSWIMVAVGDDRPRGRDAFNQR
jgi:hypothetical protein